MGVTIARTNFAARTTTGTQSITASLGGLTPKAALFTWSYATTDGTAADGLVRGMGATDGTNQAIHVFVDQHNQGSSYVVTRNYSGRVIELYNDAFTLLAYAVFSSWDTNGCTLSWTVTTGTAILVDVVFFAGSDLSAAVTVTTLTNAVDSAHDITTVGFEADDVIGITSTGVGFVHNNRAGGLTQRASLQRNRTARPTMEDYAVFKETYGGVHGAGAYVSEANCWLEFSSFDSSGYTVTTRTTAPGASIIFTTIALRYGSSPVISSKVYTYSTPTSTGNSTDTNPNFTPQFVLYVASLMEAAATYYSDSLAGSFAICSIDANGQNSTSFTAEDNVGTSNTQSLSDNQAVNLPLHSGSAGMAATFVSMQSTGPQLNWSDIETNAKKWIGIAFQAFTSGTAHTKTLTDTAEIADTISRVIGRYKTLTETTEIADTLTNARTINRTKTSTVNISDTLSKVLNKVKLIANTVNISDTISAAKIILKNLASTINISDTVTNSIGRFKTLSNTVNISDTISNLRNLVKNISNTVNISDTISNLRNLSKTISNIVNISDILTTARNITKTISNSINISDIIDAVKTAGQKFVNLTSSVNVSDALTNSIGRYKTLSNSINISDTISNLRNISKSISNTINISDTISNLREIFRTLTDTTNISDIITKSVGKVKTISNTIQISDTIESIKLLVRTLTSSIQISDTVTNIRSIVKNITNTINISDIISNTRNIIKIISNSINISDAISNARELFRTIANTINISDVISAIKLGAQKFVTLTSTIQISDTITNIRNLVKNIVNSVNISDTTSQIRNISRTLLEDINISDIVSPARNLIKTILNSLQISSAITFSRSLFITLTSNINISDILEALKLKLVTITDSINITDTISTLVEEFINIAREKFKVYLTGSKDLISRLTGSFKRRNTLLGSKDKDEHFTG